MPNIPLADHQTSCIPDHISTQVTAKTQATKFNIGISVLYQVLEKQPLFVLELPMLADREAAFVEITCPLTHSLLFARGWPHFP